MNFFKDGFKERESKGESGGRSRNPTYACAVDIVRDREDERFWNFGDPKGGNVSKTGRRIFKHSYLKFR